MLSDFRPSSLFNPMKKIIFLISFLLLTSIVYSKSKIPNSTLNLGAGIGQPYGGIGIKTVMGKNNSGFLIGLGQFSPGILTYTLGGQVAVKAFYFDLNYGVVSTRRINNDPVEAVTAWSFLIGGMIGLGDEKRFFIDLALGHSFGAPKTVLVNETYSNDATCVNVGIGCRFQ